MARTAWRLHSRLRSRFMRVSFRIREDSPADRLIVGVQRIIHRHFRAIFPDSDCHDNVLCFRRYLPNKAQAHRCVGLQIWSVHDFGKLRRFGIPSQLAIGSAQESFPGRKQFDRRECWIACQLYLEKPGPQRILPWHRAGAAECLDSQRNRHGSHADCEQEDHGIGTP